MTLPSLMAEAHILKDIGVDNALHIANHIKHYISHPCGHA